MTRPKDFKQVACRRAGRGVKHRDKLPGQRRWWTARATALRECIDVKLVEFGRQELLEAGISLQPVFAVAEPALLLDRLRQSLHLLLDFGVRAVCRLVIGGHLAHTRSVEYIGRGEPVAVRLVERTVAWRVSFRLLGCRASIHVARVGTVRFSGQR